MPGNGRWLAEFHNHTFLTDGSIGEDVFSQAFAGLDWLANRTWRRLAAPDGRPGPQRATFSLIRPRKNVALAVLAPVLLSLISKARTVYPEKLIIRDMNGMSPPMGMPMSASSYG